MLNVKHTGRSNAQEGDTVDVQVNDLIMNRPDSVKMPFDATQHSRQKIPEIVSFVCNKALIFINCKKIVNLDAFTVISLSLE